MKLRLGTRGSRLALVQTRWVASRLAALGHEAEVVIIKTKGDRVQDRAFAEVGAPGVFVVEIESALLDERIDVAVHSYKDLPSKSPEALVVAAVPERVDPADRILARPEKLDGAGEPAEGIVVGTASARRQALVRHLRPDLKTALLRGNLPTRVQQLVDGRYDAILLAAAGLERLDRAAVDDPTLRLPREGLVERRLDPRAFIPAPSQGALALQVRAADDAAREAIGAMDDADAHRCVAAERALLALVEGGCQVPFGVWCREFGEEAEQALSRDETFSLGEQSSPGGARFELLAFLEREGTMRFARVEGDEPMALVPRAWEELGGGA